VSGPAPVPPGAFVTGPVVCHDAALFTDLYELTMAASYLRERMTGSATFSLFVRRLPPGRRFLVAAGLADALAYLQAFRFSETALTYLRGLDGFDDAVVSALAGVRFSGDVRAMPEGTVFFANEPLLEITAPIVEAQLVETAVMNACHVQTAVATKAARCVLAARGRPVVEFGLRRTPGIDAGMKAARSAFIGGATSSSNVLAGLYYGVPPSGTMAHSYVQAFPAEIDAFRAFARSFPRATALLLDTYDTVTAARKAVRIAREMAGRGERLGAVRLDSGDLLELSRAVRAVLDAADLRDVRIFASGGLDEQEIERLLDAGAPIDAFGVGTRMSVAADTPVLDMAYKLVRYAGRDVMKLSAGKETWTGPKQVYRRRGGDGRLAGDLVARADEPAPGNATPLLEPVMVGGVPLGPAPSLAAIRARCAAEVQALPAELGRFHGPASYTVRYSERLAETQRQLRVDLHRREVTDGGRGA